MRRCCMGHLAHWGWPPVPRCLQTHILHMRAGARICTHQIIGRYHQRSNSPACSATPRTHRLQALAEELKTRPGDVVQRYRELGCLDVPVSATSPEGVRTKGHRVSAPNTAEPPLPCGRVLRKAPASACVAGRGTAQGSCP